MKTGPKPREKMDRWFDKLAVDRESGCWNWRGATYKWGYGALGTTRGGRQKLESAHRLSYQHFVGDPGELFVLHQCDNPRCCNPDHLRLGTPADNSADMVSKGRQKRGSALPQAKLTDADVRQIRDCVSSGKSQAQAAREYGVCHAHVHRIVTGKAWV
jgi:hypothetical protein